MPRRLCPSLSLAALAGAAACSGASASVIFNVYNGSGVSPNTINSTMSYMDPAPAGTVNFTFQNASAGGSRITDIYIEASPVSIGLLSNPSILPQDPGVSFSPGAAPHDPGANIDDFGGAWRGNLFSLSASGASALDAGESVIVSFSLLSSLTGVSQALDAEFPAFRIVEHIQANSGGAWVVNYPVPEPGCAALLLLGTGLCIRRRR